MKTIFFKNTLPSAAVAILGISGAFFTTSMQSSDAAAPRNGYISVSAPCDTPVKECNTEPYILCTANGQQLMDNRFNCSQVLYEPQP